MSNDRNLRLIQPFGNSAQCLVLTAAALLLLACQMTSAPTETHSPEATTEAVEPAALTESTPEESKEREASSAGLIQLLDPLDEPEYYCVDVPGFGRSLNLQGALTAHTCKPGADDEMFLWDSPATGQISMPAYSLCMEAVGEEPGSTLHLGDCSDAPLQQFRHDDDGQIRLDQGTADGELCLTVGAEAGEPTGGPSHLRRSLTLETCGQVDASRRLWTVGSPDVVTSEPPAAE